MEEIKVQLAERSYSIYINDAKLDPLQVLLRSQIQSERILIVTNTTVGELYGEEIMDLLDETGYSPAIFCIPDGEEYKDFATLRTIYDFLIENNFTRDSAICALGGGVVGDIAGFAAATYMRGIHFVQIPTSLLAMVDASIGGKVAVNHELSKNLIGSFYQPKLVFINLRFLKTLPEPELFSGYSEVIKYGVIRDAEFFEFLEDNTDRVLALDSSALMKVVACSCRIKADIVAQDERESGLRAILNYGHTIGHAIESLTRYKLYKHGEAVAIGMVAAARIAYRLEMLSSIEAERIWQLIRSAHLPYRFRNLDTSDIIERMTKDKKALRKTIRYILPRGIGEVDIVDNVPITLVHEVLNQMKE